MERPIRLAFLGLVGTILLTYPSFSHGVFEHVAVGYGLLSPRADSSQVSNSFNPAVPNDQWLPHFFVLDFRWDQKTQFWNLRTGYNALASLDSSQGYWNFSLDYGKGLGPNRRWIWWNGLGLMARHTWASNPESEALETSTGPSESPVQPFLQSGLAWGLTPKMEIRGDLQLYPLPWFDGQSSAPLVRVFISLSYTWKVTPGNSGDYWGNRFQYWRKGEGYFGQGVRDWDKEPPEKPLPKHKYIDFNF